MQGKNKKEVKMSFLDYYELSGNLKSILKAEIIKALGISEQTFFYKMRESTWSKLEMERINEVYKEHVNTLFNQIGLC